MFEKDKGINSICDVSNKGSYSICDVEDEGIQSVCDVDDTGFNISDVIVSMLS